MGTEIKAAAIAAALGAFAGGAPGGPILQAMLRTAQSAPSRPKSGPRNPPMPTTGREP
jgi:hypothetical protein